MGTLRVCVTQSTDQMIVTNTGRALSTAAKYSFPELLFALAVIIHYSLNSGGIAATSHHLDRIVRRCWSVCPSIARRLPAPSSASQIFEGWRRASHIAGPLSFTIKSAKVYVRCNSHKT